MRFIRTEMYFDEAEVSGYEVFRSRRYRGELEKSPGVAFLWAKGDAIAPLELDNFKMFREFRQPIRREPRQLYSSDLDAVKKILDLFVRDAEEEAFIEIDLPSQKIENAAIVEFILNQEIVMERSPPFSLSLKGILTSKNSPMWIETFLGFTAARDSPVLLFLTVPAGIIIVSSALGIGAAMQAGLGKAVKRLFDSTSKL